MPHLWQYVVASIAILSGVLTALTWITLLLAGSANSPPEQIRVIKLSMLATLLLTLASVGTSITLMVKSHPVAAAWIGGLPAIIGIAVLLAILIVGSMS